MTIPFFESENRRWGFYQTDITKPLETTLPGNVVLETDITGQGVKFLFNSRSYTSEMNIGLSRFRASQRNFSTDGLDFLYHGELRPHFYLMGSEQSYTRRNKASLVLIPMFGFQISFQYADSPDNVNTGDETGEGSIDIILDAGLKLEMIF